MKGNVIGFDPDTNTGAISGHDGKRYDFVSADWHDRRQPTHGDLVDFVAADQRATQVYLIEQEYVQPSLGEFLFSIRGRISRSQLWLKWILPVTIVYIVLSLIARIGAASDSTAIAVIASLLTVIFALFTIWPGIATNVKRAHDRDRSGWFILLLFVPILNIWPIIELLFLRGTIGSNRFGPDPVPPV